MDGNDQDPKPCLGIPTAADTIHPTEKDRRKNDREDDTIPHEVDTPCPAPEFNLEKSTRTMDGNDQNPKPCLGIPTTADSIHPTEKDRRKNDRGDDTMPHEPTSPCPAPEFTLKNQHRKPHTDCTMDGNDPDPKPCLGIPTTADTIHPTEKDRRKNDRENDTMLHERTSPCPTLELNPKNHDKPHTSCTMDGNDQNPKPCLGIPTTADTIHPTEKDRRKNDREDDTMPHEPDTPCPAPEFTLKNQHKKPHTVCTMDGNDQNPKPRTRIPTAADSIHPTER